MRIKEKLYKDNYKLLLVLLFSLILCIFFTRIYYDTLVFNGLLIRRFTIFLIISFILVSILSYGPEKVLNFILLNRYIIFLLFFIILVLSKYHGSSIKAFTTNLGIPSDIKNSYTDNIFFTHKDIRSDEWLVDTPSKISAFASDTVFNKYNSLLRGGDTLNAVSSKLGFSWSSWVNILNIGFYFFGMEYGFSISWNLSWLLPIIFSLEFFLIFTKNNKFLSIFGSVLVGLSPYMFWWSFNPIYIWSGFATLVFVYKYLRSDNYKHKVIFAFLTMLSAANFVGAMYPAWMIPAVYLFFSLFLWIIIDNIDDIKNFNKKDIIIILGGVIFLITILLSYYLEVKEYMDIIFATSYPGSANNTGGYYLQNTINSIVQYFPNFKSGNMSEFSKFISFFPFPIFLGLYSVIFKKSNKSNRVKEIILLVVNIFLLIYVTIGFPNFLSKITFLYLCSQARVVDVFYLSQLILLIVCLSDYDYNNKKDNIFITVFIFITFSFCLTQIKHLEYVISDKSEYFYIIASIILAMILLYLITYGKEKIKKTVIYISIIISILCIYNVHPLVKGFDIIYENAIAKDVQNITSIDKDARWIVVGGGTLANLNVMWGAPTINSINHYPNLDLWTSIDEDLTYYDVYNRYAHISIAIVDDDKSSFELLAPDSIHIKLSYNDIEKLNIDYVLVQNPINEIETENWNRLTLFVHQPEGNFYIYKFK